MTEKNIIERLNILFSEKKNISQDTSLIYCGEDKFFDVTLTNLGKKDSSYGKNYIQTLYDLQNNPIPVVYGLEFIEKNSNEIAYSFLSGEKRKLNFHVLKQVDGNLYIVKLEQKTDIIKKEDFDNLVSKVIKFLN